jgi:hypothetical protein
LPAQHDRTRWPELKEASARLSSKNARRVVRPARWVRCVLRAGALAGRGTIPSAQSCARNIHRAGGLKAGAGPTLFTYRAPCGARCSPAWRRRSCCPCRLGL